MEAYTSKERSLQFELSVVLHWFLATVYTYTNLYEAVTVVRIGGFIILYGVLLINEAMQSENPGIKRIP